MSIITRDEGAITRFRQGLNTIFQNLQVEGITITPEEGLVVAKGTDHEALSRAVGKLKDVSNINREQRRLLDRYIGQAICAYAALTDCDWPQAISALNLVETTGRSYKAIAKLPRIVTLLPPEVYDLPGLTTSHYDTATAFKEPSDPSDRAKFGEARVNILRRASENPDERNISWVMMEMRLLQKEFGIEPSRRPPTNDVRAAFELCSQALLEWTDEDYTTFGITRGQLRDRWEGYKADLIERDLLPENCCDPVSFTLPWRNGWAEAIVEAQPETEEKS